MKQNPDNFPEPIWLELDGEEVELHELILDHVEIALECVKDDLNWIREHWSKHPFSPDTAFAIAIDAVTNVHNTFRFATPEEEATLEPRNENNEQ